MNTGIDADYCLHYGLSSVTSAYDASDISYLGQLFTQYLEEVVGHLQSLKKSLLAACDTTAFHAVPTRDPPGINQKDVNAIVERYQDVENIIGKV